MDFAIFQTPNHQPFQYISNKEGCQKLSTGQITCKVSNNTHSIKRWKSTQSNGHPHHHFQHHLQAPPCLLAPSQICLCCSRLVSLPLMQSLYPRKSHFPNLNLNVTMHLPSFPTKFRS